MRIRFVLCHPSHLLLEEEREIFLASALIKMGHDAAYFCNIKPKLARKPTADRVCLSGGAVPGR